jgi:ribosomal protein L37AE/L43A
VEIKIRGENMKSCPNCGLSNVDKAVFCKSCGTSLPKEAPMQMQEPVQAQRPLQAVPMAYGQKSSTQFPSKLLGAGAILIIVSLFGVLIGAVIPEQVGSTGFTDWIKENGGVSAILSLLGLFGGVLSLLRRGFAAALVLGIACCFAVGPVFITTIGAIVGTILIAIGRKDFIPVFTSPPSNKYRCTVCRHPLYFEKFYKDWYCFNCKEYRELPPYQPSTTTNRRKSPTRHDSGEKEVSE